MPHGNVTEVIPASAADVFQLIHDYRRRLEWDTLLQEAFLTDGFTEAAQGATSVCRGCRCLGGIALKTQYVTYRPGKIAAVKMINRPPFFASFAATIRHRDLGLAESAVEYLFTFEARPKWLRTVLNPLMNAVLTWETRKRLRALKRFFELHPISPLGDKGSQVGSPCGPTEC
ncbi:MAG: SRPBCC family protein [Planctomycetaceae bacterium]